MNDDVGVRLRSIRQQLGLSQRKLAKSAGVANATISQIESGTINPTVSMLKRILDGIPLSLSEFFSDELELADKIFFRAEELRELGKDGVSYRQVGLNLGEKSLQMMKECYQPGTTTGKHPLTHQGEECGIVLSGKLEVTVGNQTQVLRAGDAYYFNSQLAHQFKHSGRVPCEVISACTPPSF